MVESEAIVGEAISVPSKKKSSFAGDVLKLASGATIAQALGILLAPVFFAPLSTGSVWHGGSV